jgi:alpha-ketoglutaric semialdehyde dehydrogenase
MSEFHRNFIGGSWVGAAEVTRNLNPSDLDDVIGEYARGSAGDARAAVDAASGAAPGWRRSSVQARADALEAVASEILSRREELGTLLAREEGKTRTEAIAEVTRAGYIFRFFAGEAVRVAGERLPSVRPGVDVEIEREPLGVVAIITPWNFPIAIPAWKIAPALAYGNAVVFKPAELVPGCAWALTEIIARAGFPPGVFNLVVGSGSTVGQTFVECEGVDGITFTGSADVGRRIAVAAVDRLAKVQVEMGGKNPLVVLDDADLDVAVDCAVQGAYYSTGQRCTASSRLIVTDGVHDRFVEAVTERLRGLRVDDALAEGTDLGPVIDASQLDTDLEYIRVGVKEGATLAYGGERLDRSKEGYYLSPALFIDATNDLRISREEIFGPVAAVIRAADLDEALTLANDTEYGLTAGICTTSLRAATRFRREAQAGMVMVNLPTAGVDYHVPFGGRKGSSYGPREQGAYAREFYTTVKTAYVAS